jgi:hypothetical protein
MPEIEHKIGERLDISTNIHLHAKAPDFRVLEDVQLNFTRARAVEFLELKKFPGERDVRESHVQYLYNEYISGRMMWSHVIIATARLAEDGATYRINGQHCAWMRFSIPEEGDPSTARVRWISYAVPTMEDLRALYSTFDRNAPRTVGHIMKNLLLGSKAADGISSYYLNKLTAGFKLWHWERDDATSSTPAEVAAVITTQYAPLFQLVGEYIQANEKKWVQVKRSSVVAALFATFEKAPQKAIEFWDPVVTGLGLVEEKDARYQLRNYISSHGHTVSKGKMAVSQEEMFRVCIQAWNRWRKGELISVVRSTEKRVKPL